MKTHRILAIAAALMVFAATTPVTAQYLVAQEAIAAAMAGASGPINMAIHAEPDLLEARLRSRSCGTPTGFAPSSSVKHQYFKYDGAVWGHANGGRYVSDQGYRSHEDSRVKGVVSMTYRLPDNMFGEPRHRYMYKSDEFRHFAEHGSLSIQVPADVFVEMNNGNRDGLPSVTFDKEETTINRDAGTFSGSMQEGRYQHGTVSGAFHGPNGETLAGTWTHQYRAGPRIEAVFTADKR